MYTNCAYLVTLFRRYSPCQSVSMPRHTCFFFVSSRLALKVTKHYTRKEIHLSSFHACQATVQESVPPLCRARMHAAALGLDGPPAAARRLECLVLFQARWLWRGAAWHGRYGGCNASRQLWHGALASVTCPGVCSAASTAQRATAV